MLPAGVLLLVFLTYPLGLGTWLGFTDTKIGRAGHWIGLENYQFLWGDEVTRLALFNTLFYTTVASVLKFFLGLWLAVLLNERIPFKSFFRAAILLPYIVPTALSAIAFWWMFDAQFSVISWVLHRFGLISQYIDFLGDPWNARFSVIAANVWRGVPFVAITLLAGLQTISPSLYEAAAIDGADAWQRFTRVTLPLLAPTIAITVLLRTIWIANFADLIWVMTNGGPADSTQTLATYIFATAYSKLDFGYASAVAAVLLLLLLLYAVVLIRMRRGLLAAPAAA